MLLENNNVIDFVITSSCCSWKDEAVTIFKMAETIDGAMEEFTLINAKNNEEYKILISITELQEQEMVNL